MTAQARSLRKPALQIVDPCRPGAVRISHIDIAGKPDNRRHFVAEAHRGQGAQVERGLPVGQFTLYVHNVLASSWITALPLFETSLYTLLAAILFMTVVHMGRFPVRSRNGDTPTVTRQQTCCGGESK